MTYSIIIPCFNEETHIEKCLQSLRKQIVENIKFEIIVVDNGSSDRSVEISREYANKVFIKPNLNVGGVRNFGSEVARGEFLVFIDADCTVDSNWLHRIRSITEFCNSNDVFGGGCLLPPKSKWIERSWLLEGAAGNTLPKETAGCSIVINRSYFNEIGGFNETLNSGEDSDLSVRIRKSGGRVTITRILNVTHWGNAKSQFEFLKRQIWHSYSYSHNFIKNLTDPIYLLSIFFPITIFIFIYSLLYNKSFSILFAATSFLTPLTLTAKRFMRAKRYPYGFQEFFCAYYLDVLYLMGRFIGIAEMLSISTYQKFKIITYKIKKKLRR